jgi:RimJ/RimL family protein N-acetyltransferase
MIVYGPPVMQFVADQLGFDRGFGECSAIGFMEGGEIVAGVIYHNWNPESGVIEMSAASNRRKWLTKARLSVIFAYPFDQIKCRMVIARHSEFNTRARRIWRSLGCNEYVIPALRSPSEAEVIATLTADQWRAGKFSKVQAKSDNV